MSFSVWDHFDHLCLSKQQTNTYAIRSTKEKGTDVAENRNLGQTDLKKINLAL